MSNPAPWLSSRFLAKTHRGSDGGTLPYRWLGPAVVDEPLPLVVLLHGAGERGQDNIAQLGNGAGEWLGSDDAMQRYPCFFALPQCPAEARWVEVDWSALGHRMPSEPSRPLALVQGLIDEIQATQPVDGRRLYLVGLSMGGYGTWDLISRWPQRFAAAVPICGGGDPAQTPALRCGPSTVPAIPWSPSSARVR
jgi:predicted peptidase